jgi:hypothetical protein
MKHTITILLLTVFFSCNDGNKEKELALKEKELELRERELNNSATKPGVQTDTVPVNVTEKKLTSSTSIENLIGNWNLANSTTVYIKFSRDGSFEFNDYNATKSQTEFLFGKYELAGNKLTLFYDDRAKQIFDFSMGVNGDKKYYIRRGNYYFIKGERTTQAFADTATLN